MTASSKDVTNTAMEGFTYLLKAFGLLGKKGIRAYVIIPLLINIILFVLLIVWGSHQFGDLLNWIDAKLPSWLQWLNWLFWILFSLSAVLVVFYTFALLANLISAPFNAFLSAKVQKMVTGRAPETGLSLWREIPRAIKRQLQFMVYYLLWAILALILFFIPFINLAATPVWFGFNAWMMGLQYLDYPMDNNGVEFAPMRAKLVEKRWLSLNFGGAVLFATMIPIINFLIMPTAVVAATLLYLDRFEAV